MCDVGEERLREVVMAGPCKEIKKQHGLVIINARTIFLICNFDILFCNLAVTLAGTSLSDRLRCPECLKLYGNHPVTRRESWSLSFFVNEKNYRLRMFAPTPQTSCTFTKRDPLHDHQPMKTLGALCSVISAGWMFCTTPWTTIGSHDRLA